LALLRIGLGALALLSLPLIAGPLAGRLIMLAALLGPVLVALIALLSLALIALVLAGGLVGLATLLGTLSTLALLRALALHALVALRLVLLGSILRALRLS
jgi:hypothetical protein